jgi:hypothetical protein
MKKLIKDILIAAALVTVFAFALKGVSGAQDGVFPNCTEFGFNISTSCCCTNGCCRETDPSEVVHVEGDMYRIVPSGQVIKRTGWSPDGRTIRCACDAIEGKWVVHPTAHTRCLYMPMPSS